MRPIHLHTAILLFSRSAAGESIAKPLVVNASRNQQAKVAAQLIRHTRRIARDSGLAVFEISEHQQHGATFGERFADAFRQLFERGFERVISIGNDCPALTAADLREAARRLDRSAAVFGPAADGGAYLVGLRREAFDPVIFADLDWQTERTLAALQDYAVRDFVLLLEKADLDSPADLQRELRRRFFPILLKIRLLPLLQRPIAGWLQSPFFTPKTAWRSNFALRGPPLVGDPAF